ncbi:MAG: peptidoglycan editing factor PgeF [Proteobacteria bacterium]|nr:peptidoglycan editing factor PgeF [Pseudomonadota bacterium]
MTTALPDAWVRAQELPAGVHAVATTRDAPWPEFDTRDTRAVTWLAARLPAPPVWLEQVHGTDVVVVDAAHAAALRTTPPRADAAITRERGAPLAIRHADCLPVVLATRDGGVLGVAHAGWRGLAAGVIEATVAAMAPAPGALIAWLGPAIGPTAFEVRADVVDAFVARDPGAQAAFLPRGDGHWLADLPALARRRLAALDVAVVDADAACTVRDAARFFSYRRDRDSRRLATLAWLA